MSTLEEPTVEQSRRAHWPLLLAVALTTAAADQLSKALVLAKLAGGERVHVLGPLTLTHVENNGVAFGLFAGSITAISLLTAVAIIWLLYSFAHGQLPGRLAAVGYALVVGGASANLLDRVRLGQVTDFIDLPHWPTFNLADSAICVGMALLLLLFSRRALDRYHAELD